MADDKRETDRNSILYELLILSEWIEDYDSIISKNALNNTVQKTNYFFNPWRLFKTSKLDNLRYLQTEYPWHLAVSKDGKVVAILQETLLEIKTAKDEYSSVVGKACLPNDQNPKLRKMSWSPDNSFLAVARDNGNVHIFNLFGCNVATIQDAESSNGILQPVVGLCFLQPKVGSTKWSNELLVVYSRGGVKSVLLSSLDGCESNLNIVFSLEDYYPQGISAVTYSTNHLLIVAGPPTGNENGIIVWRLINDYPYFKVALDSDKRPGSSRSFLWFLPGLSSQTNPKTVLKMIVSPDNKILACLHLSGEISLWRMPGMQLHKRWNLHEQPQYDVSGPENVDVKAEQTFCPVDICWWSNTALVIARQNGAVTVCSVSSLENLLGDSPEFLAPFPQISSIDEGRSGVIALECETVCYFKNRLETDGYNDQDKETSMLQTSIQAVLYSFTDIERFEPKRKTPKLTQRTYRMIALKQTTPEELYSRKIEHDLYEEALLLAKKYNLDCDLVYQKRWRNSQMSKENIHSYLDKVNKILWVVNECVERVPEALEDAYELLQFGLRKTEKLQNMSVDKLNAEERQLIIYRRQLLKFLDSLTVYEKIVGASNKYNSVDYDSFRKKSDIVATVNFARQENWQAVSIMFTYGGREILARWLPILSNFPETLKPLHYRSLLPEVVENEVIPWEVKKLRKPDWSEDKKYQFLGPEKNNDGDGILYKHNSWLRDFEGNPMTIDKVEEWYRRRIYDIEKLTGLVEYALSFVVLAKERGIKSLNQIHNDLLTLEALVYHVGDDTITLTKLEALNHLEQCKLLLSKTVKDTFIDDLKNYIVPFMKRCKEQNCHLTYTLVRDIMLYFGEKTLEMPLQLLNHLKQGYMNPFMLTLNETVSIVLDCIYYCPKDDQLETCFLILECLPQRTNNMCSEDVKLHDRIDRLETHLEICEMLSRYNTPRSIRYILENENNVEVGKELMQNMAEYTKSESLDFTELLSDFQLLQSKIFTFIPEDYCYELFALSQMSSECEEIIQSAGDILECRKGEKDKMVHYEKSVELVLQAARNHFEKANNFDDHFLQLSQTCLRLIGEPHPQIYEEFDLIEAVQLLRDFDVNVLPLQVRKCDQRMKLIESCLTAKPNNYKACQRLLQLAQALRIYGADRSKREGEVLMLIAEWALNSSDYQYCSEICGRLVSRNFSPAWMIVRLLAQKEDYGNNINKKLFLAFAILHCPLDSLEELIESRIALHPKHFKESEKKGKKGR